MAGQVARIAKSAGGSGRGAGFGGFIKDADGKIKWGNTAKLAGGAGAAGLASWALFDPNAADKVGSATGRVGDTLGSAVGGLGGGLTGGAFSSFMSPTVLSACGASSVCACCILIMFMMVRN